MIGVNLMNKEALALELRKIFYITQKNMHMKAKCQESHILNPREIMCLSFIADNHHGDKVKLSEISNHFHVTPPAVSQMIRVLEDGGYIERVILKNDRRSVYVCISEKGIDTLKEADKVVNKEFVRLVEHLGENDALELLRIMKKCVENAQ